MKEIHIVYEKLFEISSKIAELSSDYQSIDLDTKSDGSFDYANSSVLQIMNQSSTYGAANEYSESIPVTINTVISKTSLLFNSIAEEEKSKDELLANAYRKG